LQEAQNNATRNQHQSVDVEHLMLALLEQEGGLVPRLFEKDNSLRIFSRPK
jgi:ATP-dependent Clp protease ATP-binding subunit ClpB